MDRLTNEQWSQYERDGYLNLGKLLSDSELHALQQRIDDIMLGKAAINYDRIMMQLDANSDDYGKLGEQSKGHKGATLDYRKIQDLEFDPLFLEYMRRPIFEHICERVYGKGEPIMCFRAMFMNKPAHKGTVLPWHQDRWNFLDRDPLITVWTALDPATIQNGCVEIIPGSHTHLMNPEHSSGFLTKEQGESLDTSKSKFVELKAGEVVLLHNWTLHRSGVNRSDIARRAFSVSYMHADTRNTRTGTQPWTRIFGEGAFTVEQLQATSVA